MRISNHLLLIVFAACALLNACSRKELRAKEYLKYVSDTDNGLIKEKEVDGIVFKVSYLPAEWMALNELKELRVPDEKWKKTLDEYRGLQYCKLTVACKDCDHIYAALQQEDIAGQDIEAYLNYGAEDDFYMLSNNDTSACKLYSFSKTHGLAKQFEIALAFAPANGEQNNDRTVVFNSSVFNRGALKFKFEGKDISRIPTLTM